MIPPSGAQHRIAWADHQATVVEVGGGLRTYTVDGAHVVDGYGEDERCTGGRGQILMPWPNRLRDGRYTFAGSEQQLALTEVDPHNAIHGLVRWLRWTAAVRQPDRVVMELLLHPMPGYPFVLGLSVDYRLGPSSLASGERDAAGLTVATTATNLGDRPCPFGSGAHPYLTVGTDLVDDALLQAPGTTWLEVDHQGIPTATAPVEGTHFDFRDQRRLGDVVLDRAYTDLAGSEVTLANPDDGRRATLWMDESYRWLMLFTGDTLNPSERRRGLAVEPMTCAPNAFVSGDGLRILEPEESWTTTWGLSPG